MRKLFALLALVTAPAFAQDAPADLTLTLIPGLTTDAFYITMNRGAQAAAEALGITVNFQGAEEFNPTLQVPVLDSVISRAPDAILIAPTDRTQLIAPLQNAVDQGIPVVTVDTFIGDGAYQTGDGDGDDRDPHASIVSCPTTARRRGRHAGDLVDLAIRLDM